MVLLPSIILAVLLAGLSALAHAWGLLSLLYWLTRRWRAIEADFRPRRNLPIFLFLFVAILVLHLAEISLWAGAYVWSGDVPSFLTAIYFSAASYTTMGYRDVYPAGAWRLASVFEALSGLLLLGWSAAFFFSVVSRFFQIRIELWEKHRRSA